MNGMKLPHKLTQRTRAAYAVLLATTVLCSNAVLAQDIELDTIVIAGDSDVGLDTGLVAKRSRSASKTDTTLAETPQAVSVVSRDEMDAKGANTVSQALRYTPSVVAEANGNDVRYDWVWLRGYNAYGRTWLDGLAVPGDPDGYATPAFNSYALERVEVIKGPASVLYGQTVPGGLINQVSKRPQTTPHNEVVLSTTSHGGVQAGFDSTGPLTEDGSLSYRIVGQGRYLGTQIDHEIDRNLMLAPSITWAPDAATELTVYGYYQKIKPENFSPRFYPAVGTLIDNPFGNIPRDLHMGDYESNANTFESNFYALGYEFSRDINQNLTFRQNLRYSYADQNMFLVLTSPPAAYATPGTTLSRAVSGSEDWLSSLDIDTQLEARFETGPLDHTLLMGFQYTASTSDRKFGSAAGIPTQNYLNPVYGGTYKYPAYTVSVLSDQRQAGLYVQDQIRYENWLATLGLRYDYATTETNNRIRNTTVASEEGAFSGRVGLSYLFDNGFTPYASYSTSFLPVLGANAYGDPFEAQKARQVEVGLKYEPVGGRGMIGVSLFDLTLENGLTPLYNAGGTSLGNVQTGEQRVRGIEIEGKYELSDEIDIFASYAYSDSEVVKSNNAVQVGKDMLRVPEHQAGLWVQYSPEMITGLSINAGVRATSSYHTDTTYIDAIEIPARALVDIGAQYDFGAVNDQLAGTTLNLNVTNLFDHTYVSHCTNATGGSCNYGPGRTVSASLKWSW